MSKTSNLKRKNFIKKTTNNFSENIFIQYGEVTNDQNKKKRNNFEASRCINYYNTEALFPGSCIKKRHARDFNAEEDEY